MVTNLRTYKMALELHRDCLEVNVDGYLRDQLKRASSSVALNLAEGAAKPTGSPAHCQTVLKLD